MGFSYSKDASKMSEYQEVEIQWLNVPKTYNFGKMEFAWANKDLQQVNTFTSCKDHLQDVIHSYYKEESTASIWFPGNPNPSFDRARIIIANAGRPDDFCKEIGLAIDLLNLAEKKLHFRKTKAFRISNPINQHKRCGAFLLESSSNWMISPPMVSLYSLLIRSSPGHEIGDNLEESIVKMENSSKITWADQNYFKTGGWAIRRIFKYRNKIWYKERKQNYPVSLGYNEMHVLGVCGMSSSCACVNQSESTVPRWYRDIDAEEAKGSSDGTPQS